MIKINEKGYWETDTSIGYFYDPNLSLNLIHILKENNSNSVVDFGCGIGDYVRDIKESGIHCEGYDGNPNTGILTKGLCGVLELSEPFYLENKFDCVLSFEVGEHIPKQYEQTFLNNICNHTKDLIILSWAIIGQGGDGHINCQNNEYIINQIESRGFFYQEQTSLMLRNSATTVEWFKNTILAFKRD